MLGVCASFPTALADDSSASHAALCHSNGHRIVSSAHSLANTTTPTARQDRRDDTKPAIPVPALAPSAPPPKPVTLLSHLPLSVPVSGACGVHCPCPTIEIHSRPSPPRLHHNILPSIRLFHHCSPPPPSTPSAAFSPLERSVQHVSVKPTLQLALHARVHVKTSQLLGVSLNRLTGF